MPDHSVQRREAEAAWRNIKALIEARDRDGLLLFLASNKPIDIANAIDDLEDEELAILSELLSDEHLAQLIKESDDDLRLRIVTTLEDDRLLAVFALMHNDDEVDILDDLDDERTDKLLERMREDERTVITHLLQYPEESAGGIMNTSYIALQEDRTVGEALSLIRAKASETEQIQTIYVLGMDGKLVGHLDLRRLITTPRSQTVRRIMDTHVISIDPNEDQEDAAELVAKYNINALPVVHDGRLLGVITVDDIIDVIIEEYDEDMLRLAGANEEETLDSPLLDTVHMRLPWLLVNLATAFLASFVVKSFEATIEQVVALSAIMTIVSGMGGNAGSQTMAIVVRHLSKESISPEEGRHDLFKEIFAGIINGAVNGLVTGIIVAFMYHNAFLSVIVLVAMIGNMVIAGMSGFLVPVALKGLHQDPAVASTIFVTTATDVLGFFIFLGLAKAFLPLLV